MNGTGANRFGVRRSRACHGADNNLNAFAVDSTGRVIVAGQAAGLFGVARLQADPRMMILSLARLANNHALMSGIGAPNTPYAIQASASLRSDSFGNVGAVTTDENGNWQYEDSTATNALMRFYRLAH